jgi:hypothetical protein
MANPTEAQARLLEVVYAGRELAGGPCFHPVERSHVPHRVGREPDAWPIFQYVEAILHREHGLDARSVISEAPSIRFGAGQSLYGWLQVDRPISALQADDKVRLTVAGMARVADATAEVDAFIESLALLVERERTFAPHPTEVQLLEVWAGELRERLEQRWIIGDDDKLTSMREVLSHEPSTWHCQVTDTEAGTWHARVSPFVRPYSGVRTSRNYVDRLVETIGHRAGPSDPLHPSSLSLPEALDYLSAVWRLKAGEGKALFRVSRAEAAAKLALNCTSVDELESRLSALAGLLSQIQLPGIEGYGKLVDLRDRLPQLLDSDSTARATAAVDDLRAVIALRVWRQHPGTEKTAHQAAQRLGVRLPSEDWGATWQQLRSCSVNALSAIREEIDTITAGGEGDR